MESNRARTTSGGGGKVVDDDANKPPATARTYQEVDFLKEILGSALIAALADVCLHRPADPIEYLGHWLIRFRFNEELKKRDIQDALVLVQQKEWTKYQEVLDVGNLGYASTGFVPVTPYGPIGYGGPLFGDADWKQHEQEEEEEEETRVQELFSRKSEQFGEDYDRGRIPSPPTSYRYDTTDAEDENEEEDDGPNEQVSYFPQTSQVFEPNNLPDIPRNVSGSVMSMAQVQARRNTRERNESVPEKHQIPLQFRQNEEH